MQNPFDWEQAMETTRRSAAAASPNSENAVAGMTTLLQEMNRHSSIMKGLTIAVNKLEDQQAQQMVQSKVVLNQLSEDDQPPTRFIPLGLLALFVVGVAFGGYIVS